MNLANFFETNATEMQIVCTDSGVEFSLLKDTHGIIEVRITGHTNDLREMVAMFCAMSTVDLLKHSYPPKYLANNGTWQDFAVDIADILKYDRYIVQTWDDEHYVTEIWAWKFKK